MNGVVLFGVRSPLVTEFEESCDRAGISVIAGVSVSGAPRMAGAAPVVALDEVGNRLGGEGYLACAFSPRRRRALADQAEASGLRPAPALIDPTVILAKTSRIDEGSFINAACVIGSVAFVGMNVLMNRSASLGHHSVLEDDVSIGPGAIMAGNVRVGRGSMIGAGATILPDIRIGCDCVVAAGSVVNRNVPDGTFVAGNPAKPRPFDWGRTSLAVADGE